MAGTDLSTMFMRDPVSRIGRLLGDNRLVERAFARLPAAIRYPLARRRAPDFGIAHRTRTMGAALGWPYTLARAEELGCIFVHIPKNAGISVNEALFGDHGGGHIPLFLYLWLYGARDFDRMFKFAFVRDPADRVRSAFLFLRAGGITEGDRAWSRKWIAADEDIDAFVQEKLHLAPVIGSLHFRPQSFFVDDPRTGKPGLDFTGRFETLAADFDNVTRKLGIANSLPARNASPGGGGTKALSPASRAVIQRLYARDFESFGYA